MRTPHLMTLFCLVFASIMVVSSCKKDDDNPSTSNEFTINGDTRALSQGIIEAYGDNGNGSFDFDVTVLSDGITVDAGGDFTGTGDFIYFDLNSDSDSGLTEGRYTFAANRDAFTLVDSSVAIDLEVATFTGDIFDVTGGTVDIELSGSETILNFNLNISNGTTVTGSFRGVLRPV